MLIRPELIDRLADTLEGIAVSSATETRDSSTNLDGVADASILIYYSGRPKDGSGPVAGESPLIEINLRESENDAVLVVSGALGIVEMHGVEEIRTLEATEEAAFYSRESPGKISVITLSSHGVIQAYLNVAESLIDMDFADVADDDLRTAVALKIFAENGEVFRSED
jgi:hypothetical protein